VRELARACSLFVTHARLGTPINRDVIARCYPEALDSTPNPKAAPVIWEGVAMKDAQRAFEKELILARLERHHGNVRAARESLRLTKTTFHRYTKALGIDAGPKRSEEA
jgi:DNA-binding NtrC family response regulator